MLGLATEVSQMERFGFEQYGNPSVFESIEAPVPEPKAGVG